MKLHIKNFRSIENLDLELAPITVLYGHNGTGKSSALYAPLTLRNVVSNPQRSIQKFFNYGFADLGEFHEVVFDHNANREMSLGISIDKFYEADGNAYSDYTIELEYKIVFVKDNSGSFELDVTTYVVDDLEEYNDLALAQAVTFPYDGRKYEMFKTTDAKTFAWNGVNILDTTEGTSNESDPKLRAISANAKEILNQIVSELSSVNFVPLGRGFFNPHYSLQRVSPMAATEQEMTSLIANDKYLEYAIKDRMELILNRDFRVRNTIGSELFSLDSIDRQSRVAASLVNDGFGVNQLVYLLAKVLHPDAGIVCIEEPEIHLHPTAIRRLARELSAIVQEDDGKRLLISTHSEQFIVAFLALVAEGKRSPDDIAIYLVTKDGKSSDFQRQQVNEQGQIAGGLASFMEGEMEDMKALFGISGKDE